MSEANNTNQKNNLSLGYNIRVQENNLLLHDTKYKKYDSCTKLQRRTDSREAYSMKHQIWLVIIQNYVEEIGPQKYISLKRYTGQ